MSDVVRIGASVPALFGDPLVEGIERAAAAGADAVEFFDWESADPAAVRAAADEHGVDVAATLATGAGSNLGGDESAPAMTDPGSHEQAVADVERSLSAAAELGAGTLIVTVGPDHEALGRREQHEAVVGVLEDVADAAESAGVTVVVEPLNVLVDHPGYYLTRSAEAFEVVAAVDSPRVKVLYDVYHQQVTEGNVIATLREHVDAVGHVHVAGVPGRGELTAGELHYGNILRALDDAGYDGVAGCEFWPGGNPEAALRSAVELADG